MYSATLPLKTNAGDKTISVILMVKEGPKLSANPSMLLFFNKDETQSKFTITNKGKGTLTWETGTPIYTKGSGWITEISSESGETTTEEEEITISIDRTGLGSGIYLATIPVTSNGGKKNIIILLFVPVN